MSSLEQVRKWAQAQLDNTAKPEVRPDIAATVLQIIEQLEEKPVDKGLTPGPGKGYE